MLGGRDREAECIVIGPIAIHLQSLMSFGIIRDLTHVFSRFQILWYSRSLKCPLHNNAFLCIENWSVCHGAVRL